jgi:phosphoribosylanthranilate isomerase
MIVKICGITRCEDAEVAVEAGASALGFIFYKPSARYVTPEKARELGDGLDVWKVGVFVDESPAFINSVMQEAKLDVAQVYGRLPDRIPAPMRLWQAIRMPEAGAFEWTPGYSEAILIDGPSNGVAFNWNEISELEEKLIIAGGLDASNVTEAIRIAQPWGVDASSRLESAPGIKDHQKVRAFIKAAREFS